MRCDKCGGCLTNNLLFTYDNQDSKASYPKTRIDSLEFMVRNLIERVEKLEDKKEQKEIEPHEGRKPAYYRISAEILHNNINEGIYKYINAARNDKRVEIGNELLECIIKSISHLKIEN